ncbi:oligopeptide/dipeptide ABC transporter ATP-binding protein [Salidesulfovibrio brasiliensis]|uniref:oligopeptide/dipeptide ABC transporter ATP-binding protein n=1 Tax=Salidesulfovibrio brasiliensis TaxID=221711 RepID=UPI0034E2DFB0
MFEKPLHPYTAGLLESVPKLGDRTPVKSLPGTVPSIFNRPNGCRFHPRCPHRMDICEKEEPGTFQQNGRSVCCWLHERGGAA